MKNRLLEKYGPWAVVTGASSGIGRACAVELAEAGFGVLLAARGGGALEGLAGELRGRFGTRTAVCVCDLSTPDGRAELIAAASVLDIGLFVAAAGFGTSGNFLEIPLEEELAMMEVNCRAVVELVRPFAESFVDRGRGGVVLFGSLVGFQGVPRSATYSATKAFVQSFGEALHHELRPRGVDVLVSAPGPVRTGFADRARMTMGFADAPGPVAIGTLKALGKQCSVTPGPIGKLLTWSLATAPRFLRIRILAGIMQGMTRR